MINSLLGLLVFPQQRYLNSIPQLPLEELYESGWPRIKIISGASDCTDLKQLVRYLRNSIAHFNVEFIGLPGAGKSHIKRNLVAALKLTDKERYITAEEAFLQVSKTKIDRIYRFILRILPRSIGLKFSEKLINRSYMQYDAQNRFLARWGKSFEIFLSSPVFDKMTIDDREIRISVFLNRGAIFECINGSIPGNRVVFFDELFVQKSFIFVSHLINCNTKESVLYSYLEHIPLPDMVIHVKADINTCYDRMLSRERGVIRILKGSGKEDILDFLKIADEHMNSIVHWLKNRRNIILLEIDNENELVDKSVKDLEDKIRAISCKRID